MKRALFLLIFVSLGVSAGTALGRVKRHPHQYKVAEMDATGSISPDGRFLFYTDWAAGKIGFRDLQTGENRLLTDGVFPKISPDGKQVAYVSESKGGFEELCINSVEGSERQVVYSNKEIGWIEPMEWSPDGGQILAILRRKDRSKNQVVALSVADGSVRVLKELTDWRAPVKMSFSPDGRYVAYDFPPRRDSPQHDIFLLSANSGQEISLVENAGDDLLLGWTPDGKRVLFAGDRTGTWSAWGIEVAEGTSRGSPELVKVNIGSLDGPYVGAIGFSSDGSLYYGVLSWTNDVYLTALDPATHKLRRPKRLISHVGFDTSVEWSPDGRSLAYASGHGYELYSFLLGLRSLETGTERRLRLMVTRFGSHAFEPHWSPDGRSLIAQGRDRRGPQGRQGLYRIDVQTGEVTPVVLAESEPAGPLEWPAWRRDGKLLFTRWTSPGWPGRTIVLRDLESGYEKELYRVVAPVGVARLAVSPDGTRVIFVSWDSKAGSTALQLMSTAGGEPRELLRLPPQELTYSQPLLALAWTMDSRHILYTPTAPAQKPKVELWRISADGGQPEDLGTLVEGSLPYGLSIHPDGRRIAFTAGTPPRTEVRVLKDFLPPLKAPK